MPTRKITNLTKSLLCLASFTELSLPEMQSVYKSFHALLLQSPSFSLASYALAQWFAKCDPWTSNISINCEHFRTTNSWAPLLSDSYACYSLKSTLLALLNCLQICISALLSLQMQFPSYNVLLPHFLRVSLAPYFLLIFQGLCLGITSKENWKLFQNEKNIYHDFSYYCRGSHLHSLLTKSTSKMIRPSKKAFAWHIPKHKVLTHKRNKKQIHSSSTHWFQTIK